MFSGGLDIGAWVAHGGSMKFPWHHRLERATLARSARVLGWVLLAGGLGWLTGHLLHRTALAATAAARTGEPLTCPVSPFVPFTEPAWGVRAGLGLAALRETPAGVKRTAETACWLGQATAAEIGEWWPTLAAEKPQDGGLLELVMVRWMELDPLAAMAQVAGTAEEFRAWWAWGKVNPTVAMRQAKAFKSGYVWRVLQGAGAGDPLTAIRLAEENPEFAYPAVEDAIKDGLKNIGWRDSLEYRFDSSTLRDWAEYEPDRAFAWALDHASKVDPATWTKLVERSNESDPSHVPQVLATLAAGTTRQSLLLAQLAWTAARNLDDALIMAAAAESPTLRNRMLSLIGKNLAPTDPARSLELFREVLANGGDESARRVIRPDGESSSQSGDSPLETWLDLLMEQDPAKALAITRAAGDSTLEERARATWLARDFAGFTAALHELPEGDRRDREMDHVVRFLTTKAPERSLLEAFPDALEWTAAITNPTLRSNRAKSVIESWMMRDEAAAAAYFAADGEATDEQRAAYAELKGGGL
jgi:hypothetical protein